MSEILLENPEEMEEETERVDDSFVVDDDQKAEWCLKVIKEKEEEKAKWKAHYDELYRKVSNSCDQSIARMEFKLEGYLRSQIEEGFAKETKTQFSYQLPNGKLVLKHQQPEYVRDDDELIKWLEENGLQDYVKVKKTVDWDKLKKALVIDGSQMITEDAEIVPGITVNQREDIFKVEGK